MGSVKKAIGSVTGASKPKPKAPKVEAPKPVAQVAEVTQENQGGGSMGYGGGASSMSQGSSSQSNILDPIEATTDEEKEILG